MLLSSRAKESLLNIYFHTVHCDNLHLWEMCRLCFKLIQDRRSLMIGSKLRLSKWCQCLDGNARSCTFWLCRLHILSTATSCWKHQFSSDHWSVNKSADCNLCLQHFWTRIVQIFTVISNLRYKLKMVRNSSCHTEKVGEWEYWSSSRTLHHSGQWSEIVFWIECENLVKTSLSFLDLDNPHLKCSEV